MLLTTQYLEEADQLADRIAVIDNGRIISEGTAEDLKDTLGGDMLEVGVDDASRETVAGTLAQLTAEKPTADRARTRLRVPARDGSRTLVAAIRALDGRGIDPSDVALHTPTLDDVFLALTGDAAPESTSVNDVAPRQRSHR